MPLPRSFYARSALEIARDLLGRHLVRDNGSERLIGRIIETEAYGGTMDSASHASRGLTPRTEPMFGPPGHAYVYLIYGIHDMLNVVTEAPGVPGAVLLRAMEPLIGEQHMVAHRGGKRGRHLSNGPGKLAQAMNVSVSELNRHDLCLGEQLWLEAGSPVPDSLVAVGPRIGIDYAAPADRDAPWRFRLAHQESPD